MRVKDLVNKDFENTNIKKMEASARIVIYNRKNRSLQHQIDLINQKVGILIKKLLDADVAYSYYDRRFETNGGYAGNFDIGYIDYKSQYIPDIETNKPLKRFFQAMRVRKSYLQNEMKQLKRSIKGTRSAMTRKRRGWAR